VNVDGVVDLTGSRQDYNSVFLEITNCLTIIVGGHIVFEHGKKTTC
jgi:hypothetical protein